MRITGVYYQVNNPTGSAKEYNYRKVSQAPNQDIFIKSVSFGNSSWQSLKEYAKEKTESAFDFLSRLIKTKEIKFDEKQTQLIRRFVDNEEEIKAKYDKQITEVEEGIFDSWTRKSEKERAAIRAQKKAALEAAYAMQNIFEEKEKEIIESQKAFLELARQLHMSQEILIAIQESRQASLKRQEILQRRRELLDKKGFSQIAGYLDIKTNLQKIFIDKLDDEKAGKVLAEPIPNAILLYGPTGCGKTTFANALAQETDCNVETIKCRGSQKDKEQKLYEILNGYSDTDDYGNDIDVMGLLDKAQADFIKTQQRTIVVIDEFDRFFGNGVSKKFINEMKNVLENCSHDNHVTFILTTNNPQKIPYELRNSHRINMSIPMEPPNKANTVAVIEHYLEGCELENIDYEKILDKLFVYAPDELYSNTHLKTICDIAVDEIKPLSSPLTTEMFLQAIDKYNSSNEDVSLLRITKSYIDQFESDKHNI